MPPRPPLTSLVLHTWKEHGKPRPLTNEETSEASVRARISRSMSVEANLIVNTTPLDEAGFPTNAWPHISRSSTLDEGIDNTRFPMAFLDTTRVRGRLTINRSVSVAEGLKIRAEPRLEESFVSSPVNGMTPSESEDDNGEAINVLPQSMIEIRERGLERVKVQNPVRHRRTSSASTISLRKSLFARGTHVEGIGMWGGDEGIRLVLREQCERNDRLSGLVCSTSVDAGLATIASGEKLPF